MAQSTLVQAVFGLLLPTLFACGDGPTPVGAACETFEDCGDLAQSACIAAWPSGYCTEVNCTPGSCPDNARCVTGVTFPGVPVDALCLQTCETLQDCRGGYTCVEDEPGKICPEGSLKPSLR